MPTRYYLAAIWLVFVLRGVFYCNLIPLWEGFDEWGHYAFVEHLRLHAGALPRTTDRRYRRNPPIGASPRRSGMKPRTL